LQFWTAPLKLDTKLVILVKVDSLRKEELLI
jgi:hypothetical protein